MNEVIILEGPDGTGKTTLAKTLVKLHGGAYRHEGPPPLDGCALQFYAGKLLAYLRMKKPVIADRFYLGEHIYGPVARDHDRLGKRGIRMMERLTRAYNVREFICLPSWDMLRTGDDYLKDREKLWEVYCRYNAALGSTPGFSAHHKFDWTFHDADTLPHPGREKLLPFGAVGSTTAKLLLVGERSNTGLDLPFIALDNSSRYLDDALQAAGIPERDVAFVNAYPPATERLRPRGNQPRKKLLLDTIETLSLCAPNMQDVPVNRRCPTVVALGKEAETALRSAGFGPDVVMRHPSEHRRFHYRRPEVFVDGLRNAYQLSRRGNHEELA